MRPESIATSGAELTCAVAGTDASTHNVENDRQYLKIGIKEVASFWEVSTQAELYQTLAARACLTQPTYRKLGKQAHTGLLIRTNRFSLLLLPNRQHCERESVF